MDIPGQPGPHPPFVPSSSSPAECQDQSKLCISVSLERKKYCKLKYSRCDLHDGFQTLNTHDQRGIYNLPVFPRFVRKASSLSTSLPPCPSPCTDLSCGDPHAVPRGSRLCPRTLQGLSANIPSHGRGINAPPTLFGARRESVPKWPFLLLHPSGSCPHSSGRPPLAALHIWNTLPSSVTASETLSTRVVND